MKSRSDGQNSGEVEQEKGPVGPRSLYYPYTLLNNISGSDSKLTNYLLNHVKVEELLKVKSLDMVPLPNIVKDYSNYIAL